MNKLFDVLENCISALEQGETKEAILARYPELKDQLGPMLEAARLARQMKVTEPPAQVIQRGRVRLLQQAAQMRARSQSAPQRVIPAFQRLALALALTALFVFSGTRLVRASSSALPGENLYSVKRTWETLRLFMAFNPARREALAGKFENERLDEVNDLLLESRHEQINFTGVVTMVNGQIYVSGIGVAVTAATQMPETTLHNGAAVIVSGRTIGDGFVEATSLELLPAGSVVPVGQPVETVSDAVNKQMPTSATEGEAGPSLSGEKSGELGNQGGSSDKFQVEGSVESMNNGVWVVNGQAVDVQGVKINGQVSVGAQVEVEGIFTPDGRFQATKVDVKISGDDQSGSDSGNGGSGDGGSGSGGHDGRSGGNDGGGGNNGNDD
jgi:uncharacterized membrane protein YgcG